MADRPILSKTYSPTRLTLGTPPPIPETTPPATPPSPHRTILAESNSDSVKNTSPATCEHVRPGNYQGGAAHDHHHHHTTAPSTPPAACEHVNADHIHDHPQIHHLQQQQQQQQQASSPYACEQVNADNFHYVHADYHQRPMSPQPVCAQCEQVKAENIHCCHADQYPSPPPALPPRAPTPSRVSVHQCQHKSSKRLLVDDEISEWSAGSKYCFAILMFFVQVLLFGSLGLVFFWVFHYRGGVAWHDDIDREFNLHPLLMVSGFVFLLGQAILVYRELRCCSKICSKLVHTTLHLLVMPAVAIAAIAVFDFHSLHVPQIPDLYSLHSWMGLTTLGLFAVQFLIGFFTFLVTLCCGESCAGFRAAVLPLHVHFGLATFLLGIATCLTGLTEKAIFQLRNKYSEGDIEGRVINALGITLIALALLLTYIVRHERYRRVPTSVILDERL